MNYKQKLLDPRWQKMRLNVLQRDDWSCQICESKEKTLHVHHIEYHPMIENPWEYEEDSLLTLCCECHEIETFSLKSAKANLFFALFKAGFKTSTDFECLTTMFESEKFIKSFKKIQGEI
jgi:hypothetical protein